MKLFLIFLTYTFIFYYIISLLSFKFNFLNIFYGVFFDFSLYLKKRKIIFFNSIFLVSNVSDNFSQNDLIFLDDYYFILFSSHIFLLGVFGLLISSRYNLILFLLNFEILFLGGGLLFISFSVYWFYDPLGQVFSLFLLFLAAVDSAVGLGLFLILKKAGIDFKLDSSLIIKKDQIDDSIFLDDADDFNLSKQINNKTNHYV